MKTAFTFTLLFLMIANSAAILYGIFTYGDDPAKRLSVMHMQIISLNIMLWLVIILLFKIYGHIRK